MDVVMRGVLTPTYIARGLGESNLVLVEPF